MLNTYITQVQRLLHDPSAQFWSITDLTAYINEARGQLAGEGQCVRNLVIINSVANQEVYTFSSANSVLPTGVQSILGCLNISYSWGTMRPTLRHCSWSDFQAYLRSYSVGLTGYPTVWCQYSQGVSGSVYLWPVPSQINSMEWDCYCLPIALASDSDTESIPEPWQDAVKFYAAYLAYANSQRTEDANRMYSLFENYMARARSQSSPPVIPDFYEAY